MARFLAILRTCMSPLRSPLLPFRYISAYRTERFYERTLTDRALAERYAAHYLGEAYRPLRILDVGCGRGRFVALLSQLGHHVYGIDIREHAWWSRLGNRCLRIWNARWPFADGSLDVVLHILTLQYMPPFEVERHAKETARVLRKGGTWIVLAINEHGTATKRAERQESRRYALSFIVDVATRSGLKPLSVKYEGRLTPFLPIVDWLRAHLRRDFDVADWDTGLLPSDRACWLLRCEKVAA